MISKSSVFFFICFMNTNQTVFDVVAIRLDVFYHFIVSDSLSPKKKIIYGKKEEVIYEDTIRKLKKKKKKNYR